MLLDESQQNRDLSNQLIETTKSGSLISKWKLKKIQRKIKKANKKVDKEPFDWELFWVSTGIISALLGSLAFWGGLITLIVLLCIRIL